jgi:hypothetical protein
MNIYKEKLKAKLGMGENIAPVSPPVEMSEEDMKSLYELLKQKFSGGPVAEEEVSPDSLAATDADVAADPVAPVDNLDEAVDMADGVYYEMLTSLKEKMAACENLKEKKMVRKCYEMCYKMREKFITEMTSPDEVEGDEAAQKNLGK